MRLNHLAFPIVLPFRDNRGTPTMRSILLLAVYLACVSSSLISSWRWTRDTAGAGSGSDLNHAVLFTSCTLSADQTIINGLVCSSNNLVQAVGCLDVHKAYTCVLTTGKWTLTTG